MSKGVASSIELVVDGQLVIVPASCEWSVVMNTACYRGALVFRQNTKDMVVGLLRFVSAHPDRFCLGLYLPAGLKSWLPLPLFYLNGQWQRVQIERLVCGNCKWVGKAANPTEPSLYFGVADELSALKKASSLTGCKCPKCGGVLPRPAVWVEG